MFYLIIKDMVTQKKNFLYTLFYTMFAATNFFTMSDSAITLYTISPMVLISIFITYAATRDDKNKSEIVLNSLPLNRAQIVMSKYISAFLFATIGIIYSVSVGFIAKTMGLLNTGSISLFNIVSVLAFACIFSSIYLPMYFKFGGIRANQIMVIVVIVSSAIPPLAYANRATLMKVYYYIIRATGLSLNLIILIVGLIMFLISIIVSTWIYNNRDF